MGNYLETNLMQKGSKPANKIRSHLTIGMTEARGIMKKTKRTTLMGLIEWFFSRLEEDDILVAIKTIQ